MQDGERFLWISGTQRYSSFENTHKNLLIFCYARAAALAQCFQKMNICLAKEEKYKNCLRVEAVNNAKLFEFASYCCDETEKNILGDDKRGFRRIVIAPAVVSKCYANKVRHMIGCIARNDVEVSVPLVFVEEVAEHRVVHVIRAPTYALKRHFIVLGDLL